MKRKLFYSLFTLLLVGLATAVSAQRTVTGTVTDDQTGEPLIGANILVVGTSVGTVSDLDGSYTLNVPEGTTQLSISYTGYTAQTVELGNSDVIDISMSAGSTLDEVVVTGYASERKADIVGSVGVIDTKDALSTPSANLAQQLQGRAAGVVVSGDGAPGEGAKVRIRGFTSFGNSNPLYIIDGVPTKDPGTINPQDIESMQVLKDATAASIYGARAAQGVIIVTTKGGKAGRIQVSYDGYYGVTRVPENSKLDLIGTQEYVEYLQKISTPGAIHPVFGDLTNPTIPDRIVVSPTFRGGVPASDPRADPSLYDISDFGSIYQIMETAQQGTNWFDEVTQNAPIQSHQVNVSGGGEMGNFSASFNYFDQDGAIIETGFKRYAVRLNTNFTPKKWLRVGQNVQVLNQISEGNRTRGEGGAWGWAYRFVPYIPAFDIQGGYGGNAVGQSGNADNAVAFMQRNRFDFNRTWRVFGNMFAEIEPIEGLVVRTSYGVDYSNNYNESYTFKTYENSENTLITGFGGGNTNNFTWTWTNTASYSRTFAEKHNFKVLVGTEAISFQGEGIFGSSNTFDFEDPNFINFNTDQFATPSLSSYAPIPERLFSVFGRIDYIFNDKYIFNATVRRDGTSKITEDKRFGTFPAFGLGWRISAEPWMQGLSWLDDLKIRGGWGQMGSIDNVNAGNQFTLFAAGIGSSFYDINRTQTGPVVGYRPQRQGSLETIWEFSETTNIGLDASFFGEKLNVVVDVYQNNTNNLLVGRVPTGLEPAVLQPSINLGEMVNRGFDISVNNRNRFGDFTYDATLLFSRYVNEVTNIDGNPETFLSRGGNRISDIVRTQAGQPIASFWGYQIDPNDRFFDNQAEIDALQQDGAIIGGLKFRDLNGDGLINTEDQTWLGSPHPDFVMSLNLQIGWKGFDASIFLIWNKGNELFNNVALFTDLQQFVGGVSTRVTRQDWRPGADNSNATHPILTEGNAGYSTFTRSNSSSFFIETGSFLRGRTAQIGYTLPQSVLSRLNFTNIRIYVQAQNFFTITDYSGSDPDINIQGGDDLTMGVDQGNFPSLAQYLFGLQFGF